jgi:hypothetical protein
MTTYAHEDLKKMLELHLKWINGEDGGVRANLDGANLDGANLEGANLEGANLEGANLDGANLYGANLVRANLDGANLDGANLDGANLDGANLDGANLEGANLEGANLEGANLDGANLDGANLDGANLDGANLVRANLDGASIGKDTKFSPETKLSDGVTWKEYLEEVVPALLKAGGKALEEIANPTTWNCHSWQNCPMAEAFSVHDLKDIPALYRAQAQRFVQLFDAGLIPLPVAAAPASESP